MLGSRTPWIRDLVDLAEPGWSPSPSRSDGVLVRVPEGSPFAVCYMPWRSPRRAVPDRKRARVPLAPGEPCSPETSVGLLAAVAEPASARLRVAQPVRANAQGIIAVTADLVCNGSCGCDTAYSGGAPWSPFRVSASLLACDLCRRRFGPGRNIYMYMDRGFCMPECRYEYYLEELNEQRRKHAAETRASKKATRNGNAKPRMEAEERGFRRIFFTCDEFP